MSNLCVIGLQWGDEAKGKLVDLLTERFQIVVRYQGGANAGHTVVAGDETYKLHLIPSGILNPDVMNVVAPGVVVHPETLLREIRGLEERGIDVSGHLKLSERAHVVFPWHVEEDRIANVTEPGEEAIGTTLRGIGPCYRDKVGRRYALRLGDLLREDFEERVHQICNFKKRYLSEFSEFPVELNADQIVRDYGTMGQELASLISDTNYFLLDGAEQGLSILLEGAQGALLDVDHGTFPYVTSSNSSGVGVCSGSGLPPRYVHNVIGVAKCYSTRVGGGPFPTEQDNETGEHIRQLGKEFGTTTGRPRRCGWFDAVAVRYTARLSGVDHLSMMMLDVLSELEEIQICVGYEINGTKIDYFPSHVDDLRKVQPVYETLPGWQTDITKARSIDDLPAEAIAYVQRISELVGRPVEIISVGPDRAQTIFCNETLSVV
ncbi:MAG: adenylosuccinate synthase [Pirellulaceae bacterium]